MLPNTFKAAILILLVSISKAEMPEDDFRIINRQDLLASDSDIFEDKSSKSFTQLLFDVARDQVVVGARDTLYRLSLRGLRLLERADWRSPPDKVQLCQDKGQTEEDCHNYIKVLLSFGHKLFACGTNAFSPVCSWREIEAIDQVLEWENGVGVAICPYNPRSNVTALLSSTGEYYAGTPVDFASSFTTVSRRHMVVKSDDVATLRSPQYDQAWLNEPQFVGSFEDDQFVYFVFREIAVEFMNCGKIIYSRIARVCKNDSGGHMMMKDNWSTFLKARLNCSVPGDYPFYYDEVQSVEYLADERILVATFTTPENSIAGSAVCIYNMSDIKAAFDGPFKFQDSPTSTWEPRSAHQEVKDHFNCMNSSPFRTIEYMRYHLMYDAIQPISLEPVYKTTLHRFTHITADVTQTKHVQKQFVLFVSTQENDVYKLVVLPRFEGACLVELWRLKDGDDFSISTMQFVKETMSLYIGTNKNVVRLGVHRCARHRSRAGCVAAADPYCGWDEGRELCLDVPLHLHEPFFVQDTERCASLDAAVDGGWSSWSSWEPCMQDNGEVHTGYGEDKPDMCLCRTRRCDNPRPARGGQACRGASIAVTNCTVHGGWSAWSGWSACSAPCGIAVRSRRRACAAPEPKHGGRVCVGQDLQEVYCTDLPPCPEPELAPIDGAWSPWSPWSSCTGPPQSCGAGAGRRERKRSCSAPAPKRGGAPCTGADVEREPCDLKACDPKKAFAWTPWVHVPDNTSDGSSVEKRFKFTCRAHSSEPIKISLTKEEYRYCNTRGSCSSSPPESDPDWEAWGPWGPCSASCGGGQQKRKRTCRKNNCEGPADMLRACNTHACTGEWSCWSEWSECSGECGGTSSGTGHRTRSRLCLSPEGCEDAGAAMERRVCVNTCSDTDTGWGEWGAWSACAHGERVRTRTCLKGACAGPMMQVALCNEDDVTDNELTPIPAYSQNVEMASFVTMPKNDSFGIPTIVGCVLAAFIMGCLLCLATVIYCSRRHGPRFPWRRNPKVPSSPHYITAKQNSYVTVPLKDVPRKAKRQPSFTGISGASGILLSKSNNLSNANNQNANATPKLYPKAIANEYDSMGTLRRHTNLTSNRNNLDVEEDKFY